MEKFRISDEEAPHLSEILKGIAHPLRLRIISVLCDSDMCVNELCAMLDARQSAVSQHLAPLRMLGLVSADRTGGKAVYTLVEPRLKNMVTCLKSCTL